MQLWNSAGVGSLTPCYSTPTTHSCLCHLISATSNTSCLIKSFLFQMVTESSSSFKLYAFLFFFVGFHRRQISTQTPSIYCAGSWLLQSSWEHVIFSLGSFSYLLFKFDATTFTAGHEVYAGDILITHKGAERPNSQIKIHVKLSHVFTGWVYVKDWQPRGHPPPLALDTTGDI